MADALKRLSQVKELPAEPMPDIAKCSDCGWTGPASECEKGTEGDWESGYYGVDYCPVCEDGGCIDDYDFSPEQLQKLEAHQILRLNEKDAHNV